MVMQTFKLDSNEADTIRDLLRRLKVNANRKGRTIVPGQLIVRELLIIKVNNDKAREYGVNLFKEMEKLQAKTTGQGRKTPVCFVCVEGG
jgi:hypothetical protein